MKNFNIEIPLVSKKFEERNFINLRFKFNVKWSIFLAFLTICAITGLSNETKEFIYYQF